MQVKRAKLIILDRILQNAELIFSTPISGRFFYAVTRNRKISGEENKLSFEAYPVSERYIQFQHRKTDIFGESNISNDQELAGLANTNKELYDNVTERLKKLSEEYKDAIDEETQMRIERDKFFDEDIDVNLFLVSENELPKLSNQTAFSPWEVYSAIDVMIKHPDVVTEKQSITREKLLEMNLVFMRADTVFKGHIPYNFFKAVRNNVEITDAERRLCYVEKFPVDAKYIEYDNKRIEIFRKAGVNNDGQLYQLLAEDAAKYNDIQTKQSELIKEYQEVVDAEHEMDVKRQEFLAESVDVELQKVSIEDIPEINTDSGENEWTIYNQLSPMVIMDDEPTPKE